MVFLRMRKVLFIVFNSFIGCKSQPKMDYRIFFFTEPLVFKDELYFFENASYDIRMNSSGGIHLE
ncbi:hypothetical protein DMZ48_13075 [Robertkochia solimangrovi]|nr:hypothetical protein DMZ48_13075 [Robertkochia solimangrovi]